jgi:dienelactone hydrolase
MSRPVPVRRVTDIARWRAALIGIALLLLTPHVATGETVTIPLPTGEALRAALRLPAAGIEPRHVVIAFHGCAGLGGAAQELRLGARERDWADRLNEAGHPVLFPDSFGSRALPPACGIAHHPAPPATIRRADALAVAQFAAAQPWARTGGVVLLGWSHGASTVLAASDTAAPGPIRGAIAFYPGCGMLTFPQGQPIPAMPVLMLIGSADDWNPPAPCLALATRFPGRIDATLLAGAHHGFDAAAAPLRRHVLPNGRSVTTAGDPVARDASIAAVMAFLARLAP